MPYTISEIKNMREKITPGDWETLTDLDTSLSDIHSDNDSEVVAMNMREDDAVFLCVAPSIIDQLLQEREELKKKVENLINNRFCENHELCEGCCGSHCCDLLDNELLALFKD